MDAPVRRNNREYFFLELRDADGAGPDHDHDDAACAFTLTLSGEHTGFTFERDLAKAEDMIRLHSGGENALALRAWRADHGDTRALLGFGRWRRPPQRRAGRLQEAIREGAFRARRPRGPLLLDGGVGNR